MRVGLIQLEKETYLFMVDMHHIISDGISRRLLIQEFMAVIAGESLPALRLQYKDFSQWQNSENQKKTLISQEIYWKRQFHGEIPVLDLPTDYARPAIQRFDGSRVTFEIDLEETSALKSLALERNTSLYMVLLAIYYIFLSKLTNQEDIMIGTPTAGRRHADLEPLIGMFVNTLVLRNYPRGEKTYIRFLNEIKERSLQAFENQGYQYENLVEEAAVKRDTTRNPLFDTMFVMQNMGIPQLEIPDLKLRPYEHPIETSKFDLTLIGVEIEKKLVLTFEYSTNLFKRAAIERFITYLKTITAAVLENPGIKICETNILSKEEKRRLLVDFNDTAADYPKDQTIHQLFETQVEKTPDNIALAGVHETHEKHEKNHNMSPDNHLSYMSYLSYRELNEKTNQLARLLRAKGIRPDTVVGIMLERSLLVVMSILAVLKAGGAYLPLDPEYPQQRIISMLEHSRSSLILTRGAIKENKPLPSGGLSLEVVEIEEIEELIGQSPGLPGEDLGPISGPGNLIYVIFTSGSTGIPKGAGVYHRGFVNLLHWFVTEFRLKPEDRNLLLTSLSFDLTQKNLYASLITGGSLFVPDVVYFDPRSLLKQTPEQGVTWINCTPSMFYKMVEDDEAYNYKRLSGLKYVFLGGEPIAISSLLPWLESGTCRTEIVNTYGPTECTDICNFYRVKEHKRFVKEPVPLGKPVYNVHLYIVDKHLKLTPVGAAGELTIGGAGVGKGYINDKDLTAQKFITHSFDPEQPPQLLYKTGDLAKWLPDGNMIFLGRIDHQVKIRGFRIEPGEIEKRLLDHKAVKEAVVIVREEKNNEKILCTYIVLHPGASLQPSELREYLSRELPAYMVPTYVVQLEKIPLNPNGKVDRKSLPEPQGISTREYIAPRNETERILVEIWCEVLGIEKKLIGIDDNFFERGGHSLKATRLLARLHQAFDVDMPFNRLFQSPTVRGLSSWLKETGKRLYTPIRSVEKKEYYELSSAQQRLYILQEMDKGGTGYNIMSVVGLEGDLIRSTLEKIFVKLINRHESLRTSFALINDKPAQKIHHQVKFEIEYDDLSTEDRRQGTEDRSAIHLSSEFIRPFDLSHAPLLRVGLIKSSAGYAAPYFLLVDMHHIVSDGSSIEILLREFAALYSGEVLPVRGIQYKDYSQWQHREEVQENIAKQALYWRKQFKEEVPVLELPADFPRPAAQRFEGSRFNFEINADETQVLKSLALKADVTLFMVLLAVFNVLLSKLCSQEKIVVGTPVAGRRHVDMESIIGIFVNTLALKNNIPMGKTFGEFLKEIKANTLEAFENQQYPFEELVDQVEVKRDISRNPIFDVMFVLQDMETFGLKEIQVPGPGPGRGLRLKPYLHDASTSKFDLTLAAVESGKNLCFTFEYSTALFKESTIKRFVGYFKKLLAGIRENKAIGRKLSDLEIITDTEKHEILFEFNDTDAEFPSYKTIHQLFEEQVERTADHTALLGQIPNPEFQIPNKSEPFRQTLTACGEVHLTYRELNEKSGQLADMLGEKGVKSKNIVGIAVERSPEMVIGILAILKAGSAYLPIDPGFPPERIRFILADTSAGILLTGRQLSKSLNTLGTDMDVEMVSIDERKRELVGTPNPGASCLQLGANRPVSANIAYVLYTSGSTGSPKGVSLRHDSVVNLLWALFKRYPFFETDVYLLKTPYGFDVSVTELFGWFLGGGRLALLDNNGEKDLKKVVDIVNLMRVTHINFVPSQFNAVVDYLNLNREDIEKFSCLKYIFLAGEALLPEVVNKFRALNLNSEVQLENLYGPTEAAVYASGYSFLPGDMIGSIPIGKPLANTKLFILDRNGSLQTIGVFGELCISGIGVAEGYLNRPTLTAERFTPQTIYYGELLYRTGDICRWLEDGNIEFLGRSDNQVKIRGFRIELGEIENQLLNLKEIKEVVVMPKSDQSGDSLLCAYIVPRSRGALEISQLRNYLSGRLPGYMVPAYFLFLTEIPLTANGKVDRKALPEPAGISTKEYIAPRDEIERVLVETWSEVLAIEKELIGIDDNFFERGGHSLKATRLLARLHQAFDVDMPFNRLFQSPTVRGLSSWLKETGKRLYMPIRPVERKEYYELSSAQQRLYILREMDKGGTGYNIMSVVGLEGDLNRNTLEKIFVKLIERHESLRTSFALNNNKPVQKIHDQVEFEIDYYDLSTEDRSGIHLSSSDVIRHLSSGFIRPFDLSHAPLLRVGLIKFSPGDAAPYFLLVDMHHIVSDGSSIEILLREFAALYSGEVLPVRGIQYKDYSQWQHQEEVQESIAKQALYWQEQFKEEVPVLELPTDFPRPAVQRFEGSRFNFEINADETQVLKSLALKADATLFMVLLALFNVLLSKLCSQEEIVVGTPVAGRRHVDMESIIGIFVNTLALKNNIPMGKTFGEFLKEIKENTLEAFENQQYPFEELVEQVEVKRDISRNPIFDVMFVLQDMETFGLKEIRIPGPGTGRGLTLKPYLHDAGTSKFDLTLGAVESGKNLCFTFQYSTTLFKESTIKRFVGYFKKLLAGIRENKANRRKLSDLEIITGKEKQKILFEFNDIEAGFPSDKTIGQLFLEQVTRTPDHIALVGQSSGCGVQSENEKRSAPGALCYAVTYRELNEQSQRLSRYLWEQGLRENHLVALIADPSLEMIQGILAILKTGCAYVPLNPTAPPARINRMLKESNTGLVLTTRRTPPPIDEGIEIIVIHDCIGQGSSNSVSIPANRKSQPPTLNRFPLPGSLAYIIYTSGSTGIPKGVPISYANLSPLLHWGYKHLGIGAGDRVIQNLSYYFDWSVWEIFITLTTGASLHITSGEILLDPVAMADFIDLNQITILHITPTQYGYLVNLERRLETLKYLFIGAEKLTLDLVRRSFASVGDHCRVFNMYGPTEATIISAVLEIHRNNIEQYSHLSSIPIGRPVGNMNLLILDKHLNLCPLQVPGELWICGEGVSSGYLNNPELTAEKFNRDLWDFQDYHDGYHRSHMSYRSYIIYRTGDLARWLWDGNIEFLGRADHQVKIRGFRIELGEIENRLLNHNKIRQAVVIDMENRNGDKYLCGYLVAKTKGTTADEAPNTIELKEYLSQTLPGYMVPSYFVWLKKLPLNASGKIDRNALPQPEKGRPDGKYEYTAPRDTIETELAGIWEKELGVTPLGIHDNFFDFGGHSLRAVQVISKIHKVFGIEIRIQELFQFPTISEVSRLIGSRGVKSFADIAPQPLRPYYELSYSQTRLWFLHKQDPNSGVFNIPVKMTLHEAVDEDIVRDVFKKLMARHESLRTSFKEIEKKPVQVIRSMDEVDFHIEIIDLSGLEEIQCERKRNLLFTGESNRIFNLEVAPLCRVKLVKCGEQEYDVIFNAHHIISDGWSMEVLKQEFTRLYESHKRGRSCDLEPHKIQYKDYAAWHNRMLKDDENVDKAKTFWKEQLSGSLPLMKLPYNVPPSGSTSKKSAGYRLQVPGVLTKQLREMARENHASLFMVLLAGFNLFLSRLTGQMDIVLAIPAAARQHESLENIFGMFVNTLILRTTLNGTERFADFFKRFQANTFQVLEYQNYPMELICSELKIKYPEISVFFNMLNIGNLPQENIGNPGCCHVENVQDTKFDLVCYLKEYKDGIRIVCHYFKDSFRLKTIEKMMNLYLKVLEKIYREPLKKIEEYHFTEKRKKLKRS